MIFTEEKAKEIQNKFELSNTVINKWRFRNKIPDKYFSNTSDERTHEILCNRIVDIVNHNYLNVTVFAKLTNTFPKQFYSGKFKIDEAKIVRKEIVQLRLNITEAFKFENSEKIKKIIYDNRFFLKNVLKDVDNTYYSRCIKNKNDLIDKETFQILKNEFFKFALFLNKI